MSSEASLPREGEIPASLHARFEDFRLVGRGGMGAVYRARDIRLGRVVAVKLLFRESADGGLLKEARAQARLVHRNVCEVYEAGVADHVPFIVMRFVEGGSLSRAAAQMSLEEKVGAVRDAALGLHEAHRAGLIHRDVKPGNLLVERGEDGQYRTIVCDFGIARDTTDEHATLTGTVHGTPAYMSPEQAQGKARSLDRRSDVYGLGATLYQAIAGRPPIEAPGVVELLKAVIESEPRQLRAAVPEIPADLDAIVMKCLEKEPGGRYESAKALAEDLQRFLEGDPVRARPTTWGARLVRRAKKHRGKVAVGAAAALIGLGVGGMWIRDLRIARERAALSREMGGAVREMELFLRTAYTLPLHDVEREREIVRARLRDIESRMASAGEIAAGPGHDALGRGYLALQEPRAALEHLTAAKKAGEEAPGLDYALGLARIALYREGLEKASRIQKEGEKKAFLEALEKEHKEPALVDLKAAIARGVESPAYARGLVALMEGRPEEALSAAKEAFEAAPWLYEAKKLEGDALLALGNQTGHDKVFDAARTKGYYDRAAEAYRAAGEVGRSDPEVHEATCELWTKHMESLGETSEPIRPSFEAAKGACERAVAASPGRGSAHLRLAMAHNTYAFWVAAGSHGREAAPEEVLGAAAASVEEAARRNPGDAFAAYLEGDLHRTRAIQDRKAGRDEGAHVDRAIAGFDRALALDPRFLWALNEECDMLKLLAEREARLGKDPSAAYAKGQSLCGRAIEIDPDFMPPRGVAINMHRQEAERRRDLGLPTAPAVEAGLAMIAAGEKKDPGWRWGAYFRAGFHRITAEHLLGAGKDPTGAITAERAALSALVSEQALYEEVEGEQLTVTIESLLAEAKSPSFLLAPETLRGDSTMTVLTAEKSGSPAPSPELEGLLSRARGAYDKLRKDSPKDMDYAMWASRVEIDAIFFHLRRGDATADLGAAALAPIASFVAEPGANPRLYLTAAKAREARAWIEIAGRRDPESELGECVAAAERAAAEAPGIPEGQAVLGRCRLGKAQREKDSGRRSELARGSVEALGAAARANAILGGAHARLLAEAERIAKAR